MGGMRDGREGEGGGGEGGGMSHGARNGLSFYFSRIADGEGNGIRFV